MYCSFCNYSWCWSCGLSTEHWYHGLTGEIGCNVINNAFAIFVYVNNPILKFLSFLLMIVFYLIFPAIAIICLAMYAIFCFFFGMGACFLLEPFSRRRGCFMKLLIKVGLFVLLCIATPIILSIAVIGYSLMVVVYYLAPLAIMPPMVYSWCIKTRTSRHLDSRGDDNYTRPAI